MNSRKNLTTAILLVVFVLAGLTIFLGIYLQNQTTAPTNTNAQTPSDCQNLTSENPGGDGNMTPISYCPGSGGRIRVATGTITQSGKLVIYCFNGNACDNITKITINGTEINKSITGTLSRKATATDLTVTVGDIVIIGVQDINGSTAHPWSMGWVAPDGNNCGGNSGSGIVDETANNNKVTSDGFQVFSKECWGDTPVGQSDFDFNDFYFVLGIAIEPTATPTMTFTPTTTTAPTQTATLTPTRTATPTPTRTPTNTPTGTLQPTSTPTGTPQPTLPPKIPPTALIDDKTDTFIVGGILILLGFGLYAYVYRNAKLND